MRPLRTALALALGLGLSLLADTARAGRRLLLVRAQGVEALLPMLEFGDGYLVQTEPLRRVPYLAQDSTAILVFEPETRRISVADAALANLVLGSTTIGALLAQPGAALMACVPAGGSPDQGSVYRYLDAVSGPTEYRREDAGAGTGDECLRPVPPICGDVEIDLYIGAGDVALFRQHLVDPTGAPWSRAADARCSVIGSALECDLADVVVLSRHVSGLAPRIAPVCSAAAP